MEPVGTLAGGEREPWLAACLAGVFPGLGRWYAGDRGIAALQFATAAALVATGGYLSFAPGRSGAVGLAVLAAALVFWVISVWDAHRACRARAGSEFEQTRRSQRDAWKTVFLSRLVPGLGQLYDRRWPIGILLLAAFIVLRNYETLAWGLTGGLLAGIACLDAGLRSRGRRPASVRRVWGVLGFVVLIAGTAPIAVGALRDYVVRAFRIPAASMAPTLEVGDCILVDMGARNRARTGDIVLLPFPDRPGQWFVKTVFASAGDLVEFRHDGAYRNGERAITCFTPDAALEGVAYGRRGAPYRVPEGAVFALGDNYLNSNDSRFLGPYPVAQVRGRAYKIYWPPRRARTL